MDQLFKLGSYTTLNYWWNTKSMFSAMEMKYHKADEGYKIVHSNGQERTPKPEFFVFFSLLDERLLVGGTEHTEDEDDEQNDLAVETGRDVLSRSN